VNQTTLPCPTTDLDMTTWEFAQNPYAAMEEWRALGPVVYNAFHDRYMVTSYRNCAKVLGNVKQFNSQPHVEAFVRLFGGVTMEAIDSPRHHEMKAVWAPYFRRDTLEARRPMIERIVGARVDGFVERVRSGEVVDAIPHMTRGIPTYVIAEMLGVESSMMQQFAEWSDAIGASADGALDPTPRGQELLAAGDAATRDLNAYVANAVRERRAGPTDADDLISRMVHHEFADSMEEQEIIASNTQLVFAGNETTATLMASTLLALGQHPDQRRAVVADRSLIPQVFEEVLRWATITQAIPRYACSEDSAIEGVPIPVGARIMPLQGAGNRDPERWERPTEFDIFREQKQHLGFGFGMHVCLGANLARLESQIWLNALLDAMPDYVVAWPVEYGRNFSLRGPANAPIALA